VTKGPIRSERSHDLPSLPPTDLTISLPLWLNEVVPWNEEFQSAEDRMDLAIALSRENIRRQTGGPFGACVFERDSGRLVSVGVNSVLNNHNSTLHAEMVAIMAAQQRLGTFTLHADGLPVHELVASCDPCAMCFGAILWSGVRRVLCGASRDDAALLGFDEGPVFPASYSYLQDRGVEFQSGIRRQSAASVLEEYGQAGGEIYNG
jgi:tRNA(Arg) A34 adenosine deaminase TadA